LTGLGFRFNIVLEVYIYTKNSVRALGILWIISFPVSATYRKSRAVDSKPAKAGESSHGAYQPFASQTGLGVQPQIPNRLKPAKRKQGPSQRLKNQ
jgi:hypothetical protein